MPSPDLASDDQRWTVFQLFTRFGISDVHQMCADAARILKLESGLTDLRELTSEDATELISELRRAAARERTGDV
jgi:hypothetical protein